MRRSSNSAPRAGDPKTVEWRIEKDPYIGNTQLVMLLPDGKRDLYYPAESP